jgi:plasmid maintenance system antidote protein VapI
MAVKLGQTFRQNPRFWIDLQIAWDLDQLAKVSVRPLIKVA